MTFVSILLIIVCVLLALVVLAQAPKGGLASGFTGAQQIGGVQNTVNFLEKGTWTLAGALMVLCLFSAYFYGQGEVADELDAPIEAVEVGEEVAPGTVDQSAPSEETATAPAQTPDQAAQ
jgi:preprotein translocase subunit SecG